MIERDSAEFVKLIVGIGELYNTSFTAVSIELYWNALRHYTLEDVRAALCRHIANPDVGKYLPKPADIIVAMTGSSQNQALLAWTKVLRAIQNPGSYASVGFDDSLIHVVIKDMQGWIKLGLSMEEELPFIAKEFVERYRGYLVDKPKSHPQYLIGIIEGQNSTFGYIKTTLVLIGDPEKAKLVITTGQSPYSNDKRLLIECSMAINNDGRHLLLGNFSKPQLSTKHEEKTCQ